MDTDSTEPDFDVALSFAGEDRDYVERLAMLLRANQVRVFYDEFMLVETWGVDTYSYFDDIYRKRAKFAVVFVSDHYARKAWTSHERQSAQARALQQQNVYLLPVRLDDTELPGLRPTIGYVDARKVSPEALAELIERKLAVPHESTLPAPKTFGIPKTTLEQEEILAARPGGWEYLLFAGALWKGKVELEGKFRDYQLKYARRNSEHFTSAPEVVSFIGRQMYEGTVIGKTLVNLFTPESHEWAFGAPGAAGDPEMINHLAGRVLTIYEDMLDWVANIRGTLVPPDCENVLELAAQMMSSPIAQAREFIDSAVLQIGHIPGKLARGEPVQIQLDFVLSIDENVSDALDRELDRLAKQVEEAAPPQVRRRRWGRS